MKLAGTIEIAAQPLAVWAVMTYEDADATFHEAGQIQEHLAAQDAAINALLDKVDKLEASARPS